MKILKVNELHSDVYKSAGNKLRGNKYFGDKPKERGFELIKWGTSKEKIPGEFWVTKLSHKRLYEAWIIPEAYIGNPFVDISDIRKKSKVFFREQLLYPVNDRTELYEKEIGTIQLFFYAFEFDPISYDDYSNSRIKISLTFYISIYPDGKEKIEVTSYIDDVNFIFSNRADAVRFKKEIPKIDWIRHLELNEDSYYFKEGDAENTKDLIYEYSLLSMIPKEFEKNHLSVNKFWG